MSAIGHLHLFVCAHVSVCMPLLFFIRICKRGPAWYPRLSFDSCAIEGACCHGAFLFCKTPDNPEMFTRVQPYGSLALEELGESQLCCSLYSSSLFARDILFICTFHSFSFPSFHPSIHPSYHPHFIHILSPLLGPVYTLHFSRCTRYSVGMSCDFILG